MSYGFFSPGARRALAGAITDGHAYTLRLLRSWPTSSAQSLSDIDAVGESCFVSGFPPSVSSWSDTEVDGIPCLQNAAPFDFGTAQNNITGVVGWALFDDTTPIAWGPLVDSRGAEVVRSFQIGDEVQFPSGAIKVGVA